MISQKVIKSNQPMTFQLVRLEMVYQFEIIKKFQNKILKVGVKKLDRVDDYHFTGEIKKDKFPLSNFSKWFYQISFGVFQLGIETLKY